MTKQTANPQCVNFSVVKLWQKHLNNKVVKWPLIYPELNTNGLLVIGFNPALPKPSNYYKVPEFNGDNNAKEIMRCLAVNEKKAKSKYSYFKPFRDLAKNLDMPWEHVDLFFYRETKQSTVKGMVFHKSRSEFKEDNLNCFGKKQIVLSKRLIILAQPKIILVANAYASQIFKQVFRLPKEVCGKTGHYTVRLGGKDVPVFLSSMLTGQRALDVFSRERLFWHMIKEMKSNESQNED